MPRLTYAQRTTAIAASVVLLHALALWALQTGLLRSAVEVFVPAEIISEFLEPSPVKPVVPPAPIPPRPRPLEPVARVPEPLPADVPPAPNAPVVVAAPPVATEPVVAPLPVVAPPPKVELPSSDAQYLQNPKPAYPPISKRFGEQGKVLVRVLIDVDGTAKDAKISKSSGFDRLDKAALATVRSWRFVPGKRGGVPEAMWFVVPINFVLE